MRTSIEAHATTIVFDSFSVAMKSHSHTAVDYKAAYAQDMLEERGISSTLKKLPPELIRSCGTGLYLRTDSIQPVQQVFDEKQISTRGIYQIRRDGGNEKKYIRMK